ncbi:MerR family transcriptional regulator [Gordonibacter massiliensis (ex Traore et al. 2017)]|uniref:MerR family transcriptional regulator n=1 Tax=Gordonibacter massiliensis (ex Traore et al. 2017) TaxID=1841863 RepID=A0A842JJ30_9ACTN|nr:MerR family transcriptional regulator [Gordonibacter massiliensis (ex Traore et al. 2017)]MBC2890481.1 MerR family transcriptional regulator [Gordonibacter massiliensis (ex Traore et al. 2017)]
MDDTEQIDRIGFEGSSGCDRDPVYGIADVVSITGISAFTIRYYDKCGFFPDLHRDKRGVRSFSEADIAQLHLVEALRKSGLSIEGIQYFVRLCKQGSATQPERLRILRAQETVLEYQREELDESLKRLHAATVDLESTNHPNRSDVL